jgi:hypothetical protein
MDRRELRPFNLRYTQSVVDGFNAVFRWVVGHPVDTATLYNVLFYLFALLIIIIINATRRLMT